MGKRPPLEIENAMITRIVYVLLLLLVGGFCFFGFMATFEPMEPTPWIFRIVYALGFIASLAGLLFHVLKIFRK